MKLYVDFYPLPQPSAMRLITDRRTDGRADGRTDERTGELKFASPRGGGINVYLIYLYWARGGTYVCTLHEHHRPVPPSL